MATSIRNALTAAIDKLEQPQEKSVETSEQLEPPVETKPVETKPVETKLDQPRDDNGKFTKKGDPKNKEEPKPEVKAEPQKSSQPTVKTEVKHPARPTTWKKEYWEDWEKLDPRVAEYLNQREQEYAKGVSTYKNEWESVKPLIEAITPFRPLLQQHNIPEDQWIKNLGNAHAMLALGSPQQKLQMFQKFAQDYQVPIEQLFVQGQDGKLYFNSNYSQPENQTPPPDFDQLIEEKLLWRDVNSEVKRMEADKEHYPHFEQVRETMSGLLQSGLAENLSDAYEAAIRHPRHSDIWEAQQQQLKTQEEEKQRETANLKAQRARGNAISPKTATPSGQTEGKPKGLRSQIEAAVEETIGGGRV